MVYNHPEGNYAQGIRNTVCMEGNPYTGWNDFVFYRAQHQEIQDQIGVNNWKKETIEDNIIHITERIQADLPQQIHASGHFCDPGRAVAGAGFCRNF
jgi:hypothetical protein